MKFFRKHQKFWQAVVFISSLALILGSLLPAILGK